MESLEQHIQQAKKGSQKAFRFLLDEFWGDVYSFQLKRTQDEYIAEEITIQTFSKAFDKIGTYKEEFKFKTWLFTISKNIHLDLIRNKNIQIVRLGRDDVKKIVDENPTAEDKLITAQNLATLLTHIKQLKPHYQEVINLRYFQEMSYKEISEKLDSPMNNVKVKLLRAKKLLSEIIKKN